MNPGTIRDFLRSPSGRLLAFAVILASSLAAIGWYRAHKRSHPMDPVAGTNATGAAQVIQSVNRPMEVFRPPPARPDPVPGAVQGVPSTNQASPASKPLIPPISLLADSTAGEEVPKALGPIHAPYGRLIACETVVTVDSSSIQTPIIGLVTDDLWHDQKLVIPAGTEVHGTAQADRKRERIASGTSWTLVWQSGEELRLRAIALDREFDDSSDQKGWGITDGSAGLRGQLIRSDDLAEIKLFAATFLSGAASALTEKETTLFGTIDSRSLNNAPLKGAEGILGVYAQRIQDSIERDGFYVRVPSGKQFYLYVLQTIDPSDATHAGTSGEAQTTP